MIGCYGACLMVQKVSKVFFDSTSTYRTSNPNSHCPTLYSMGNRTCLAYSHKP